MSKRYKILILDDEQDILDVLTRFLDRKKLVDVVICTQPAEAISIVKSGSIDLLLTDIMMPEIDGVEVLKQVKASNPSVSVIMMTAYSTMDKILECEKLGAIDYVTKPFISLKDVENKILTTLGL